MAAAASSGPIPKAPGSAGGYLLVETIFTNVEGIARDFRWLRNLRNSYTAHRHGSARQCAVAAIVDLASGKYRGRGVMFMIYDGLNQEEHSRLLSLISMAIRYVEEIFRLEKQFDAEAGAIAHVDLLKLRPSYLLPPNEMNKSRGDPMKGIAREPGASS